MASTISIITSLLYLTTTLTTHSTAQSMGVNWGTSSSHPLPPDKVVHLLKSNNITKVKLFDADPLVLQSLSGSGIDVVVGVPNSMLRNLSSSKRVAESWVHDNLTRFVANVGDGGVRIQYIAVGDEPFLQSYGEQFKPFVVGAVTNIQLALIKAKLDSKVKIVVPCNSDVYTSESGLPSKAYFRPDLNKTMAPLLTFLSKHSSPFYANIYPFLSIHQNKNITLDLALFKPTARALKDGRKTYKNSFDLSFDTLVTALSRAGFPDMEIVVGQIGWPTDGAVNATSNIAQHFMEGLVEHLQSKAGSPLRPGRSPTAYIFSLLDEDLRSISTGNFERHWGIFTFDGQAKYQLSFGQSKRSLVNAQTVEYYPARWCVVNNNKDLGNATASAHDACSFADCSALSPGGSCANISWPGNISYAFNSYYQQHDQSVDACNFGGLGLLTTVDPSVDNCRFAIQLRSSSSTALKWTLVSWWRLLCLWLLLFVFPPHRT
ncbi:hypothetical protein Syun_016145 [Stephania yunnanensis]|uniref:glucan endo-1,3-beta-D-glucosidase n=1 Tax=Stephania yunnanensis TaxID=152371 RepID=A0AAP0J4M5_9MAGN